MVGKIVGTAAFLSLIALIWLLTLRDWNAWTVTAAMVVFTIVGAFATVEPADWRRKGKP